MSDKPPRPNQIQILKMKLEAFLRTVSLRSDWTWQPQSSDDLVRMRLQVGSQGVKMVFPNMRGSYNIPKNKFLSLQWENTKALADLVAYLHALCPNVLDAVIRETCIDLMQHLFNKTIETGKNIDTNEDGEIDSIYELLDLSDIDQYLEDTLKSLRQLTVPQVITL